MRNVNALARRHRGAEVPECDSSNEQVRAAGTIDLTAHQDRSRRTGAGSGYIWHDGVRSYLPEQPLAILQALLDAHGGVVSRDELRSRLWPGDTFVDFEHGVNAAVKRLREALGDISQRPAFCDERPLRVFSFDVSRDRLVLNLGEVAGNIWSTQAPPLHRGRTASLTESLAR